MLNIIHFNTPCLIFNHTTEDVKKLSTEKFSVSPHAWPFRPGIPFVDEFNKGIKEVISGNWIFVYDLMTLCFYFRWVAEDVGGQAFTKIQSLLIFEKIFPRQRSQNNQF